MELKEGRMSGQEIAQWLGISYKYTYKRNPKHYQKKLKDYCEFSPIRGGVIIHKVHIAKYDKNYVLERDRAYLKAVHGTQTPGLCTCAGIARVTGMSQWSAYRARDFLYGETTTNVDYNAKGYLGKRQRVWAARVDNKNNYRFMTPDEEEIFYRLARNRVTNNCEAIIQ